MLIDKIFSFEQWSCLWTFCFKLLKFCIFLSMRMPLTLFKSQYIAIVLLPSAFS